MVLSLGGVDLNSVPKKLLQRIHWFLPANMTNFDSVHLRLDTLVFTYDHNLCDETIKIAEVYAIKRMCCPFRERPDMMSASEGVMKKRA